LAIRDSALTIETPAQLQCGYWNYPRDSRPMDRISGHRCRISDQIFGVLVRLQQPYAITELYGSMCELRAELRATFLDPPQHFDRHEARMSQDLYNVR